MSACIFLAADVFLKPMEPSRDYPLAINIDTGEIFDGGADDNFFLYPFDDVDMFTDKKYGVVLEWNYTDGRARRIMEYIRDALQQTESVELWHVWLMGYYEFEDRPFVHRQTVSISELTTDHVKHLVDAKIWNIPDKTYPDRPSFYCLTVKR